MANETKTEGRRGRTVYNSTKLHAKRDRKRREAEDRQMDYDKLSLAQKIKRVESHPGESKRELARLTAELAKPVKK